MRHSLYVLNYMLLEFEVRTQGCAIFQCHSYNVAIAGFLGRLPVVDELTKGLIVAQTGPAC